MEGPSPRIASALRWVSPALSCLIAGLAIYAVAFSIRIIVQNQAAGLFADQWELVGLLVHGGGKLTLRDLWSQHNEHRVPVEWILGWLDLRLFGGRNVSLLVETFLLQGAGAILFVRMFRKFGAKRGPLLTVAALALFCAYAPLQVENLTWGFQVAFVLAVLGGPAAFAGAVYHSEALAKHGRWISGALVFSFAAAFAAECGLAAGLAIWPILVLLGFVLRFPRKSQILTASVGAAAIAIYLVGYRSPARHADPWETIRQPALIVKYVVTYFGYVWDESLPSTSSMPAPAELLSGLALIFSLVAVLRLCLRRQGRDDLLGCFLTANMLFAIATAVLTSLGRVNFGIDQATSSRYQTVSLLYWGSLATFLLVSAAGSRYAGAATAAVQIAIVGLMLVAARQYGDMQEFARDRRTGIGDGYAVLANWKAADPDDLTYLYPGPEVVPWYRYLRSLGLGPDASEVARQGSHSPEVRR